MTPRQNLPPVVTTLAASLLPLHHPGGHGDGTVQARQAAVLVLLFPGDSGPHFLLTERPASLRRHPGQIALPGGGREPVDRHLWDTARREAREELGLDTGELISLGRLEDVLVSVSNYIITPFVAWLPHPPSLKVDEREVADVIEAPLDALLDRGAMEEETWELRGMPWRVTFYRIGGRQVWGATARILSDLARGLQTVEQPLEHPPGSVRLA